MSAPGLGWCSSGAPASTAQLLPAPHRNVGFQELQEVSIGPVPAGDGWSLCIDDEPMPVRTGAWVWTPGFYAGEVLAELVAPDGCTIKRFCLDVSPSEKKLGHEIFDAMLKRLWDVDPALVLGEEPPQRAIGTLGAGEDPLIALARLRRHGPAFVRALVAITRAPLRTSLRDRALVGVEAVRRIDAQTVRSALRDSTLAAYLGDQDTSEVQAPHELRFDVPVTRQTFDAAANRYVLGLVQGVLRRTHEIEARFGDVRDHEDDSFTRTALAPRWPRRLAFLEGLRDDLKRLLRRDPFATTRRAELTAAGLNACAAHPLYARAQSLGWRSLRRGIEGTPLDDHAWISPTWELYERWCAVEVLDQLRALWPTLTWERVRGEEWTWRGHGPHARVELVSQAVAPAWDGASARRFKSLSRQRVPDVVVFLEEVGKRRFVVLDAKYRVSREAVLDAMSSAHLYQDSLRWHDVRPEVSLLLVPAGGGAPWLEDAAVHIAERVGVVALGPEDAVRPDALRRWLAPAKQVPPIPV